MKTNDQSTDPRLPPGWRVRQFMGEWYVVAVNGQCYRSHASREQAVLNALAGRLPNGQVRL